MKHRAPNQRKIPIRLRRLVLGYLFIVLGILGLFLPLLQGLLFIGIGIIFLKDHALWANKITHAFRKKFPKFKSISELVEAKIDHLLAKIGLG